MDSLSKTLMLKRTYYQEGTNGVITMDGVLLCYSIELPWRNNKQRISCISEGRYLLTKKVFSKHGEQIAIPHVIGRSAILIHSGNNAMRDLQGCIAPVSTLSGIGRGVASRKALTHLKSVVYAYWDQGYSVYLHIIGHMSI